MELTRAMKESRADVAEKVIKESGTDVAEKAARKSVRKMAIEFFEKSFQAAKKRAEADFRAEVILKSVEEHSKNVAKTAEKLAGYVGLDSDEVFIAGLLHDIGKTSPEWRGLNHGRVGRDLILEFAEKSAGDFSREAENFSQNISEFKTAARVAMTHTWYAFGEVERGDYFRAMEKDEVAAVKKFMKETPLSDIDLLIQLVDNMVGAVGVMTISDRFCDILVRHEPADASGHLKALYHLKQYFDAKAGMNIYELFREEIIRNALQEPNELAGVESASDFRAPE